MVPVCIFKGWRESLLLHVLVRRLVFPFGEMSVQTVASFPLGFLSHASCSVGVSYRL